MNKRIFLCLVLVTLITGGVFAQTHWASAEVNALGFGLRYEYLISPFFTVGGYFHLTNNSFLNDYDYYWWGFKDIGFGADIRLYPGGRRFFIELGAGYNHHEVRGWDYGGGYEARDYSRDYYSFRIDQRISGFGIVPGFGWLVDIGLENGFFISSGTKFPLTFGKYKYDYIFTSGNRPSDFDEDYYSYDAGFGIGVIVFFGVGYTF